MVDVKMVGRGRGGVFDAVSSEDDQQHHHHNHDEEDDQMAAGDLRRGPWTVEEDFTLINYIALHGDGRWNTLARSAGLKRTGKSCRLRWLNYLRPDVRRGNITLEEQLLILELHSRWGNRWSKIAQQLPGRTDNEIKNYWRTRVQKHAKQLKCDVNSKQFKDTMRYLWMPRLVERIQAASGTASAGGGGSSSTSTTSTTAYHHYFNTTHDQISSGQVAVQPANFGSAVPTYTPENSSTAGSSDSFGTHFSPVSDLTTDCYNYPANNQQNPTNHQDYYYPDQPNQFSSYSESLTSPSGGGGGGENLGYFNQGFDYSQAPAVDQNNHYWMDDGGDLSGNLWNVDDIWFLQQQQLINPDI